MAGSRAPSPRANTAAGTVGDALGPQGTWGARSATRTPPSRRRRTLKFRLNGKRMKEGEWVLVHMLKAATPSQRAAPARTGCSSTRPGQIRDDIEADGRQLKKSSTSVEITAATLEDICARGHKSRRKRPLRSEAPVKVWTKKGEQKLPDFRPPQLATLVTEIPEGDGWLFEMKLDGYRAIAAIAGDQVRPLHAQRQ